MAELTFGLLPSRLGRAHASMALLSLLRQFTVGRGVDIIEQSAVNPVVGGADGALHPAHE
ncbi:MAG: hypothetical protein IJ633_08590 [Prevotella sp.]|nr:hypothetical protein [Prevotella sp.]